MKRLFRRFFLVFFLGSFSLSVYQLFEHWNVEETLIDITKQLRTTVSDNDIRSAIEASIQQQNYDDARMYLSIAKSNGYLIDYQRFQQLITQQDTKFKRVLKQAGSFAKGFIKGESANIAGIAGAISADFTVIGDIRDLKKQYNIHQQGKPVNELIVILSGAGIGLTAATIASMGVATPAKTGTSLVKLAVKTRRLSRRFQQHLMHQGRKIFDWSLFTKLAKQDKSFLSIRRAAKLAFHPEAMRPLKIIAGRVNKIRKASSASDTLQLLKYVDNTVDLRRLEKITIKHGRKTKGLFKLVGKGALRTVRVLRKTMGLMLSILSSLFSAFLSSVYLFSYQVRKTS